MCSLKEREHRWWAGKRLARCCPQHCFLTISVSIALPLCITAPYKLRPDAHETCVLKHCDFSIVCSPSRSDFSSTRTEKSLPPSAAHRTSRNTVKDKQAFLGWGRERRLPGLGREKTPAAYARGNQGVDHHSRNILNLSCTMHVRNAPCFHGRWYRRTTLG